MYPSTSVNGLNSEKKFLLINSSDSSSNMVNNSNLKSKMISNNIHNNHNKSSTKLNGINYNHTKSQKSQDVMNSTTTPNNKRKKQDSKAGKGLRHFSTRVCEKVRSKGTTTYNEVADELVAEFSADPIANRASFQTGNEQEPFDQKNIRRRVYDAINVLWAINIISKEKKEIKWVGLPSNAAQECSELEKERTQRLERIKKKKKQLRELLIQQIAFKNLINRNQREENPDPNSIIKLPFIIVNTDKNTLIDCSISRDKSEYVFKFGSTFEIHDDFEVMKRMGLAYHLEKLEPGQSLKRCDYERALQFLPEALRPELDEMIKEKHVQILN